MGPKTRRLLKWMFELEVEMFDMFGEFMVKEGENFIYSALRADYCKIVLGIARWLQVGYISERVSLLEQV